MRELKIFPKKIGKIPVEAEVFSPSMLAGKTVEEVGELYVHVGNKLSKVKEFFELEGDISVQGENQTLVLEGDFSKVKYIGSRMTKGVIVINGDAGMHTGAEMSGGEIRINGSVEDWAGAEMKGGLMIIDGDAGHQLGCAYRGSSEGMTGGCIAVKGSAGIEAGFNMRRGMIVIQGDVDQFAGAHSNGGQIFVFGETSKRAGAMARGNGGFVACLGSVEALLPTYRYDTTYKPVFMKLYMRQLKEELGIVQAEKFMDKAFKVYKGDLSVGGNFEILVADN
jgi:formylmethanofuran dehydrogenase subunit C